MHYVVAASLYCYLSLADENHEYGRVLALVEHVVQHNLISAREMFEVVDHNDSPALLALKHEITEQLTR